MHSKLTTVTGRTLTSKVRGDKLAEGSFTFPAVSLAVNFLTLFRSGTW